MRIIYINIWRTIFRFQILVLGLLVKITNKKTFTVCIHLRSLIFFLLFISSLSTLGGIKGQIAGNIVDAKTKKSLSYVTVIVVGTSLAVDCEKDGSYHITNISPGKYDIQARGIGYLPLTVKNVVVEADHSSRLDLELFAPRTIKGTEVVVEEEEEILKMDISSKIYYSNIGEVRKIPLVSEFEDYLSFYSLREKLGNRKRESPDILYLTDGFNISDNRLNQPVLMPPLSAVKNVSVFDGGFDAEYGNIGSCVVNVIEKEGTRDGYHGSANFVYVPSYMSHHGNSIFDSRNVHIRPFVDETDSLCWRGVSVLPEEEADDYVDFEGWIEYAEDREREGDTLTPNEWRDLFMYVYRAEGSDSLGQISGSYGDKPGYVYDFGFGGPFPGVNIITFYVSNIKKVEPFSLPVTIENYCLNKTDWKMTFHIKPEIKFNVRGLFEITETVTNHSSEISSDGKIWAESGKVLSDIAGEDFMYWTDALNPYDIRRYGWGFDLSHSINASTFYDIRLFYSKFKHSSVPIWEDTNSNITFRDTTELVSFGNISIPRDIPFGYESFPGNEYYYRDLFPTNFIFSNSGRIQEDTSEISTINFAAAITSQINSKHQLNGGIQVNHDNVESHLYSGLPLRIYEEVSWSENPFRVGFYLQDKFFLENSCTKLGVRLDYYNFGRDNERLRLSPRLGISTPLEDFGKIYFNFGYFYSMCAPEKLYGEYINYEDSIGILGNTRLDCLEKISYELGFEKSIFDRYLFSISFYNSDYNHLIDDIWLLEYGGISYSTYTDNFYGSLKGLEFSLKKKYGKYFRGFLKYNISAGSYRGPGLDNIPIRAKSSLRLLLTFNSSDDWGKVFKNISAGVLYIREGGDYFNYDPYADNPFLPGDPDYINNLKWEDEAYWNLMLSKDISIRGFTFGLYAEVNNLFDSKYITGDDCFRGGYAGTDKLEYLRSLHLPMYNEERYASDDLLVGGNDKVGEVDEDYIDKPDFEYLYYTNPRFLRLGIRVDF